MRGGGGGVNKGTELGWGVFFIRLEDYCTNKQFLAKIRFLIHDNKRTAKKLFKNQVIIQSK